MLCENFAYPKLLYYFEEISKIPRGSYNEAAISEYLERFALARGLECYRDGIGNVLINMSASEGLEDMEPLLLQGHTDMVCEKNAEVEHDFLSDPLELYVKDGWLRAYGTTLGADNGVAVAAMLCLLDSPTEPHRALQCLFTVSEEVGLDGAKAFDYSKIYARRMINMDSADESLIIAGCAGGLRSSVYIPICREAYEGACLRIRIRGLFGGHSGEDIHRGRANANKLLGRVLGQLLLTDGSLRLVSVSGGTKENAIPREAEAVIVCGDRATVYSLISVISEEIKEELCADDGGFDISVVDEACGELPMTEESGRRVIFLISTIANGVFGVNPSHTEIVEYSRNLGIAATTDQEVECVVNSRSAREGQLDLSARELELYALMLGGRVEHFNRYPGWVYAERSAIREEYMAAYREIFGTEPKVEVIHAGLECGIIKKLVPDMDMLSCGPVVVNLHSPDEALELASFERFFRVIRRIVG